MTSDITVPKPGLILLEEDFKHYKFRPIQEFFELVTAECPHWIFKESSKMALEYKDLSMCGTKRRKGRQ